MTASEDPSAGEAAWNAKSNATTCDLSGGTRRKLKLVLARLGEPDVLLLDEPYQGFDRGT